MTPKEIVQHWITYYNNGEAAKLAAFYHDDATLHQVAQPPVTGKENIEKTYAEEFAITRMQCRIESLLEDTPWVILEWKDNRDFRGCVVFHFEQGRITLQRSYWDRLSYMQLYNLPQSIH